jgi:hypothetical protein
LLFIEPVARDSAAEEDEGVASEGELPAEEDRTGGERRPAAAAAGADVVLSPELRLPAPCDGSEASLERRSRCSELLRDWLVKEPLLRRALDTPEGVVGSGGSGSMGGFVGGGVLPRAIGLGRPREMPGEFE